MFLDDVTPLLCDVIASILSLWKFAELSQREIARRLNVNQSTVSRLIKQVTKTGSTTPQRKRKCGKKRKTTSRHDAFVMRQSKLDPRKTSFNLQRDLAFIGTEISASAVRKRPIMGGKKVIRPVKKQLLNDKMKKKRYEWAKKHKSWTEEHWKKRHIY